MDTVELNPLVTYFVGANGSCSSTLLEAMAVALGFNAEGGAELRLHYAAVALESA